MPRQLTLDEDGPTVVMRGMTAVPAQQSHDRWMLTLAHELRSPLGAVLLALDELRMSCGQLPESAASLDAASRASWQMEQIIEDVLDFSRGVKAEAGMHKAWANVASVVAGAVAAARPIILERHHSLSIYVEPRLPPLAAKASRVQQVLTNLLVNAAKFTDPRGHISLIVETELDMLALSVRDNGIGIPVELLPRIFDGAACALIPVDRTRRGFGVGLALVKSLVELHGGTVSAHSDGAGTGSEFVVRLPLGPLGGCPGFGH